MDLMKQGIRLVMVAGLLWQPALAAPQNLQVSKVADDLTLSDVNGQQLRFRDVVFPDKERAKSWMESHLLHRDLAYSEQGKDRYGATLVTTEATEEAMLKDGVAMLYSQGDTPPTWSKAEQAARANKKGVWGQKDFVLTPQNAGEHMQEFRAIEGTITKVHVGKDATYINFGDDWKTDLSVTVRGRERRALAEQLGQLAPGKKVQVRGMLYEENGPMLRLTRPDQLAILPGGVPVPQATEVKPAASNPGDTVINVGFTNGSAVPSLQGNGSQQ